MKKTVNVRLIQASMCHLTSQEIFTFECEYPRAIHAQLLTHRVFSKNSSSTRAVPLVKAIEQIETDPCEYIWTQNQAGMQGEVITDSHTTSTIQSLVNVGKHAAIGLAKELANLGVHKQNAGRFLEPFQNIKIVLTATEWDNWDWLRLDSAAQPEIQQLAQALKQERDKATFVKLRDGEWHVPYVYRKRDEQGVLRYYENANCMAMHELTEEEAIKLSLSCCAQVSYRRLDSSMEKAEDIYKKLFSGSKVHASPAEHIAKPIPYFEKNDGRFYRAWPKGLTHVDRQGNYWSGNFKDLIQYRQLLPNHDITKKE